MRSEEKIVSFLVAQGHSRQDAIRALNLYKSFHGTLPKSIISKAKDASRQSNLPDLTVAIGWLDGVTYRPFGSTEKDKIPHIHHFGDGGDLGRDKNRPMLVAGGDGQLYIVRGKSKYYLSNRGIVY